MKSLFVSICLLLSVSAFAQQGLPFGKDFAKCVKQNLPNELSLRQGNRQYGETYSPTLEYVKGDEFSTDATAMVSPLAEVISDQVGLVQTAHGERQYEERGHLEIQSLVNPKVADMGLDILFQHSYFIVGDDGNSSDVHVNLQIQGGLPYLTVDRHIERQCTVDMYGREHCTTQTTYANLHVVTPATFQSKLYLVNAATQQTSQIFIDGDKYKACLSQIH